jgi:AcrR family transcriptional regulator
MPDMETANRETIPGGAEPSPKPSARERIMETALRLFYSEGVRATGIDRIIAESGVAKMSFYRHFPAKTDLVCAFLEERHRRWMAWFGSSVAAHAGRRGSAFLAVADALEEWFASPDFRGCAFINTAAEFTQQESRERAIAAAHKRELEKLLEQHAADGGLSPAPEAGRLALLAVDGAIVRAQMCGASGVADDVRKLLQLLHETFAQHVSATGHH